MLRVEHEVHRRRLSRNVGLGLVLGALIFIVFGVTVVKVRSLDALPPVAGAGQ
jgi:hypothetical protein